MRAILFDLGGVIIRTEYQAPREHLAERLNVSYEDLYRIVFDSETSRQASLGALTTEAHWESITRRLGRPISEAKAIHDEFFAGDVIDMELMSVVRSMRPRFKTGVISNAWPDTRQYLVDKKMIDAFDEVILSAEVHAMKPDPEIYRLALSRLEVAPQEAVFVDDTPPNVEAAKKLGMRTVLFRESARAISDLMAIMR